MIQGCLGYVGDDSVPNYTGIVPDQKYGDFFGDSAAATWLYPRMIVGGLLRIMVKFTIPKKGH